VNVLSIRSDRKAESVYCTSRSVCIANVSHGLNTYIDAKAFVASLLKETCRHGLINYIDTKAKCRHLKILTCKGTLRQVFIRVRVYRLEIQPHVGIIAVGNLYVDFE
jgi:hypothetical protein